ncbi:hypothetical protein CNR22_00550 [Sphingobacteriaceae bacterium]|nr:hypothetical protein CNR22_00550 [Sphingobacteriaceae bacterium]
MKAIDIIKKIYSERGQEYPGEKTLEVLPISDLSVHKREFWSLSVTADPGSYFVSMDKKFMNKSSWTCKFPIKDLEEGIKLCADLSKDFGTLPCKMDALKQLNSREQLFLAIHIHPEFSFTPSSKAKPATQEVVLNYFNA